jgi:hypothetical protein
MAEEKKPEDIEKEKKELDNKKRLTQQSLLLMNLKELSKLNRDKFTKGEKSYKNFLLLEDSDPWSVMTRLMGVNMLPSSDLKTEHFSSLVPEIRLFLQEVDKKGQTHVQEISFPTHAGTEQKARYNQSIHSSIAATTAPNIGIQSIDWTTQGKTALLQRSSFIMNVKLYAERLSDFFASVPGTKSAKYSDLFSNRTDKGNKSRLKVQIGWSIDSEYEKIMAAQGSSPGEKKRIGHAIKQMREQKELLDISLTTFDFDFAQEGAVTMNITYKAYIDDRMESNRSANILFDQNAKQKENALLEEIEKLKDNLEEEAESNPNLGMSTADDQMSMVNKEQMSTDTYSSAVSFSAENIAHIENKLDQKQRKLAEVYDNRAAMYASFVEELIKDGRVRTYTVAEDNIIYRFNLHSSTKGNVGDLNSVCSRPEAKNFPGLGLFFVKDIPISGGDGDTSFQKGSVKMYVDKAGVKSYAYFPAGSSEPHTLPPMAKKIYTEEEILTLAQQLGHNQSSEDTILSYLDSSLLSAGESLEDCSSSELTPSEQTSMSKKINREVKNATDMDSKEEASKKIAKVFDEVSKPEYSEGHYNIKYFFLGDLMEIALSKLKANKSASEIMSTMRFISGPIQLNNYGSDSDIFNLKDLSIKNGVLESTRKGGKKATKKKVEKPQTYIRNIADIPVSLNCFLHYFNEEYVSKNVVTMSFGNFITDIMKLAIRSIKIPDEENALVPKQDVSVMKTNISVPIDPEDKNTRDYFGFDKSGKPPSDSRVELRKIVAAASKSKTNGDSFEQVYGSGGLSLREAKLGKKSKPGSLPTMNYVLLHNIPKSIPPESVMDFIEDSKIGIPHFFIGGKQGLLKHISFSLISNKLMEAHYMTKEYKTTKQPKFPIKGRYDVNLTLFGNTFFTPGSVICVNPSSMRMGNHKSKDSPISQIGIAGYYNVKKVSSYIQAGQYETKLECSWAGSGNGHTQDWIHHTKTGVTKEK